MLLIQQKNANLNLRGARTANPTLAGDDSGGGGYTAKAVRLNVNGYLKLNAAGADSSRFLFSLWTNNIALGPVPGPSFLSPNDNDTIFLASFPDNSLEFAINQSLGISTPTSPLLANFYGAPGPPINEVLTSDAAGNPDAYFPQTSGTHTAISADLVAGTIQVFKNGLPQYFFIIQNGATNSDVALGTSAEAITGSVPLGSANSFFVGTDGYNNYGAFDAAELQFWSGVAPDLTTNIGKLISAGKPVDTATAAAAFGAHSILLSGNNTGFGVNGGTLGTASVRSDLGGTGLASAGSVTLTGAQIGQTVYSVFNYTDSVDVSADFEATISGNDHIQQVSGDLSGKNLIVTLPGVLTNSAWVPGT